MKIRKDGIILRSEVNKIKKSNEVSRRQFSEYGQSWFSKRYACWANNHNGWSKMKKKNRRMFKSKLRQEQNKEIREILEEMEN